MGCSEAAALGPAGMREGGGGLGRRLIARGSAAAWPGVGLREWLTRNRTSVPARRASYWERGWEEAEVKAAARPVAPAAAARWRSSWRLATLASAERDLLSAACRSPLVSTPLRHDRVETPG